jgi:hypothetical protein
VRFVVGLFILVCAPLVLLPAIARAEYRAYILGIGDPENAAAARKVTTTLDDLQYPGYYYIKKGDKVWIQETWMCWKRGDEFEKICPNPHPGQGQTSTATNQATNLSTSSASASRAPAASH